ncbi:sensor histidine kinase [Amycolatopsis jiangsuensis]|uniref:histidine kinase n=1 Tax=Amycolatopsis jiangsuensis TaxID=1181879 RepID=A0A840J6F1_9PSEU|nr:histidine kinase [Amycolatopsis jiangsuensis]MBB4689363.1 signal transduction histidine kinase [Amycolatopsis jiangsuensis]
MNADTAARLGVWQQTWRLLAAVALGALAWLFTGIVLGRGTSAQNSAWYSTGDPLVAVGCLVLLFWRRRFPFAVALVVTVGSAASTFATGASLLVLGSLATRRRPVEIGVVVAAYAAASLFARDLYAIAQARPALWLQISVPLLTAGIAATVGVAIGARRDEVRLLRDRADSAEREQAARAAQARVSERNRIAREMHDVLAHRVSLIAMQAGVLGHRDNLTTEEIRVLARGVADGSHQALEELRDVLGVLRAGPVGPEPPQPSLDRLPELVAGAQESGLAVTLTSTVPGTPPDVVGRTGYRIVQEGLTNAGKHAPGARVEVTVDGAAGDGLRVRVRDSGAARTGERPPSSGFGLLGLSERVGLAGGELDHHPLPGGGFVLSARLPWPEHGGERNA